MMSGSVLGADSLLHLRSLRHRRLTLRPTLLVALLFGEATASPATVRDSW